uniref:(northern house mosquito) hypothetical protein n=2 Tax=Culex pipiens TaxID=7175 RepID=A0A8D8KE15_CULPI
MILSCLFDVELIKKSLFSKLFQAVFFLAFLRIKFFFLTSKYVHETSRGENYSSNSIIIQVNRIQILQKRNMKCKIATLFLNINKTKLFYNKKNRRFKGNAAELFLESIFLKKMR